MDNKIIIVIGCGERERTMAEEILRITPKSKVVLVENFNKIKNIPITYIQEYKDIPRPSKKLTKELHKKEIRKGWKK